MAEVELRKVTKIFENGTVGVKDVSFKVEDGEFVVILGPSGCGKTTTLRLIAGLEQATSGEILIDGKVVNHLPPKDRDIAMVFQNYALYPHMNVFDNMAFGLKMRKVPKDEIKRRVLEAAKILGIEHLLDRKPRQLSGGQRQRVALGRAIVRHPKVFLFDEPLSNLDAKMRVHMRAELAKLHKRLKATSIYVTHDQVEAMTLGDKIVLLNNGTVQQIADPITLYFKPANKFVAGFIGSPPMNFFEGRIEEENGTLVFRNAFMNIPLPEEIKGKVHPGQETYLGVRPEHIYHAAFRQGHEPSFKARVDLRETLGNEVLVYYSADGVNFVSRITPRDIPPEGSLQEVFVDTHHIHLFDRETEENLTL